MTRLFVVGIFIAACEVFAMFALLLLSNVVSQRGTRYHVAHESGRIVKQASFLPLHYTVFRHNTDLTLAVDGYFFPPKMMPCQAVGKGLSTQG